MIKVETENGIIRVFIPVAKDPEDMEAVSKCQASVIEDLLYLYKSIEDNYGQDTLFFMLNLAATQFALKHDELVVWEKERKNKNESDD